ncbi:magnesium/cobalt transporter CorA [Sphaerochaeta sp. PS]|uniref:magnesium/cobalt transporter CorA n=1 Tax=Sphaerochaeta sp. PS TaxID=3076336 RepID=UPI0028A4DFC8|nr:magnesium/cobalt transporter CorA [Sphaerochaeta sp. PS]MDT4762739.1 magnesium/cobalt transporter CorA [Sphaerochaeta sp. PS]
MPDKRNLFLQHKKKEGMRPGSLIYVGDTECEQTRVRTHIYNDEGLTTVEGFSMQESEKQRWIEISGLSDIKGIVEIAKKFSLSNLSLEDAFSTDQRMKLDYYDSYFSLTLRVLDTPKKAEEQLSLFVGDNWLISIVEHASDIFLPVFAYLSGEQIKTRKANTHLLFHALVDRVVDQYLVRADELDQLTEEMEELVINTPEKITASDIHRHKRRILHLRRITLPLKDLLTNLIRSELVSLEKPTVHLFRDTSDHALWLSEECEMLRDTVSGLMEVYLSSLDMKMNKIMKVLTIISTIFIPLTFLTGLYGMNFMHIPFAAQQWGFYGMVFCCVLLVIIMAGWFKRKRWW